MTERQRNMAIFALREASIFQGLEDETLLWLLEDEDVSCVKINRGSTIFTPASFRQCLALVVKGSVQVRKGDVVMSVLGPGEIFGAVTLYSRETHYVTSISALSEVTVLFLEKNAVERLLERSPQAAKSYIAYLTERIYYLNHKIDGFTSQGARRKLCLFLLDLHSQQKERVALPFSLTQLAERLNVSRASLYRAFHELEQEGAIQKDGKLITILKKEALQTECV